MMNVRGLPEVIGSQQAVDAWSCGQVLNDLRSTLRSMLLAVAATRN